MEMGKIVICLEGVKDSPSEEVKDSPSEGLQLGIQEKTRMRQERRLWEDLLASWRKSKKRSRKRKPLMPEKKWPRT